MFGRGKFVLIEGLDRCGKDTQLKLLLETYKPSVRMAFPNEELPSGYRLRAYLQKRVELTDAEVHNLFAINRKESMDLIRATLNSGVHIFCSRYAFSGAVYTAQKGYDLARCCEADRGIIVPDVTVLLHCSPEKVLQRSATHERYETEDIQLRVRELYFRLARFPGVGEWHQFDVGDKSIEKVQAELTAFLAPIMESEVGEIRSDLFSGLEHTEGI